MTVLHLFFCHIQMGHLGKLRDVWGLDITSRAWTTNQSILVDTGDMESKANVLD